MTQSTVTLESYWQTVEPCSDHSLHPVLASSSSFYYCLHLQILSLLMSTQNWLILCLLPSCSLSHFLLFCTYFCLNFSSGGSIWDHLMTVALTSTCFLSLSVHMSLSAGGTTRRTKKVFWGLKTTSSKITAVSHSPASSTSSGGETLTPVLSKVWYRKQGMCDSVKSASLTGTRYQGNYRWQPQKFSGTFFHLIVWHLQPLFS